MQINTGIPLFNGPVDPQGTENQSYNVIFNTSSTSTTSSVKDLSEGVMVVRAFGLTDGQTITVNMVSSDGITTLSQPLVLAGTTVQLSTDNTCIVIDISGKYTFTLSAGLGTVSCVFHISGTSAFSYRLANLVNRA